MKRLAGCLTCIAIGAALWSLRPSLFLPTGTAVINWWHADAMDDCSDEPIGRANYWVPTADQIAEFERQMAGMMLEREAAGVTVPPPGQRFFGQYIGYTRKGVRLMYGNFVPIDMVDDADWPSRWSPFEQPICVADGGRHFWGIVYNPETKELEQPVFHGRG